VIAEVLTANELVASEAPQSIAFDRLYETYFPFVWRMLRRLGVQETNLCDAAQDVFVVVSRRQSDLRSHAATRSFIYGTIVRVAHEHRRTQKRVAPVSLDTQELPDMARRSAHQDLELAQDVQLLDALLSELDEDRRQVFVLVELEQLTVPEIAALTGWNSNTIYSRLRAARAAFEGALSRHRAKTRRSA
jgi:RNA polymerase sigma-70 factor, ECF subfamily